METSGFLDEINLKTMSCFGKWSPIWKPWEASEMAENWYYNKKHLQKWVSVPQWCVSKELEHAKTQVWSFYMLWDAQHKVIITSHILRVSSVGTPVYLHPTNCSQIRAGSTAVWRSVTGSRLPAALAPCGFGMSWTCVVSLCWTILQACHCYIGYCYSGSSAKESLWATLCNSACPWPQIAA